MGAIIKIIFFLVLWLDQPINAQESGIIKIHSHNDYLQELPFWTAYGNDLSSIEIDIFLREGVLFATHSKGEIKEKHTLENLYLKPVQSVFNLQIGSRQAIQLLIDIKSETITTLDEIIKVLKKHPALLNNKSISFVISGNRPSPEKYVDYPDYIQFDYQSLEALSEPKIWNKVALVSMNFKSISNWNGLGNLSEKDTGGISKIIAKAHELGKPFRFWGCPDTYCMGNILDLGMGYLPMIKQIFNKVLSDLYFIQFSKPRIIGVIAYPFMCQYGVVIAIASLSKSLSPKYLRLSL